MNQNEKHNEVIVGICHDAVLLTEICGWIFYRTRWQLTRLSRRPSSRLRKVYGHI